MTRNQLKYNDGVHTVVKHNWHVYPKRSKDDMRNFVITIDGLTSRSCWEPIGNLNEDISSLKGEVLSLPREI